MMTIAQVVANLDGWLETMRAPGGYGGPVVHWWRNCLSYTGPGLDWRYEGIILGYLILWQRTGQEKWLAKAKRAGDDLVQGQLPGGNFRASSFELNLYAGGTPHEAAADIGLLSLALTLRQKGDEDWRRYAGAAERNLRDYYLARLWDEEARSFRDDPNIPSLVPNKACTAAEAFFAWAELSGTDEPIERFALPTLRAVLSLQVKEPGRLVGAIPQNTIRDEVIEAYFPYYIARCIPAFIQAYQYNGGQQWLDAAVEASEFIGRQVGEDGLLPQVLYRRGLNRFPQWISPLGDVLRAADLMAPYGGTFPTERMEAALLAGVLPSGGITTAKGFAAQVNQRYKEGDLPDFRDLMPVVGWCDKAFRYLAGKDNEGQDLPSAGVEPLRIACQIDGRTATWQESTTEMNLICEKQSRYLWRKGEEWAAEIGMGVLEI